MSYDGCVDRTNKPTVADLNMYAMVLVGVRKHFAYNKQTPKKTVRDDSIISGCDPTKKIRK